MTMSHNRGIIRINAWSYGHSAGVSLGKMFCWIVGANLIDQLASIGTIRILQTKPSTQMWQQLPLRIVFMIQTSGGYGETLDPVVEFQS